MPHVEGNAHQVWSMMADIGFAMLVTHDGNVDHLRARPMSARPAEDENAVWFLTSVEAGKDDEIVRNPNVCIAFADPGNNKYVSITGRGEVSNDRQKIRELWTMAAKAWWKDENDPSIRVLRVTPDYAEYWDSPGTTFSYVKMAVAAVTGGKPDLGENHKVDMKSSMR